MTHDTDQPSRATRALEALAAGRLRTATDLANAMQVSRPSGEQLLNTLTGLGYLLTDAAGGLRLTPKATEPALRERLLTLFAEETTAG